MDIYQAIHLFVVVCLGIAFLLAGTSLAVSAILDDDTPNVELTGAPQLHRGASSERSERG